MELQRRMINMKNTFNTHSFSFLCYSLFIPEYHDTVSLYLTKNEKNAYLCSPFLWKSFSFFETFLGMFFFCTFLLQT